MWNRGIFKMEIWDILDEDGNKTGRTMVKGEPLQEGEYHLVVHIWIINRKREILIQKRADHLQHAPGIWAITGGAAIQGEDSIMTACRETKEELGIEISPKGKPTRYKRKDDFTDIWVVESDVNIKDIVLEKEEVSDVKWVTKEKLKMMIQKGEFHQYNKEYFKLVAQSFQVT